ncbi:MAG TPA: HAD-IC family P-type ATPase [Streptosporangiaceae bacterium]|nr:HAD-IC family P-type ATPase [Streptosporangiaceae bacterium]
MADAAAFTPPVPAFPVAETPPAGLSSGQVAERRSRGLTNAGGEHTSRSVAHILRVNILTRFNLLLGVLLAVILAVGQPQDALFGIGQELRVKRTLDRLAVLSASRVRVIRDGAPRDIAIGELVAGDLVDLRAGDQLAADGVVRASASLQADESLLTGESEPVDKQAGDRLLSSSFVVAGSGGYQATGVGAEAYAAKLAAQARRFTVVRSELVAGINQILRYVTWAIPLVAALLVISRLHTHQTVRDGATSTVAALVGMVPQGRVLLTSVAFGVAAVTLARRQVLVLQLPAVEGLARVDVVCFDKTGTLTDGTIAFDNLIRLDRHAAQRRGRGQAGDGEHRTRRQPVHHQNGVGDAVGRRRGRGPPALPVPAPPSHHHRHPGHRRSLLLPRARAEPPPLPARVRRPGAAVRRSRRAHHHRGDILGLRPRAGTRPSPGRAPGQGVPDADTKVIAVLLRPADGSPQATVLGVGLVQKFLIPDDSWHSPAHDERAAPSLSCTAGLPCWGWQRVRLRATGRADPAQPDHARKG